MSTLTLLDDVFTLATAARYVGLNGGPANAADKLPIVYGDLSDGVGGAVPLIKIGELRYLVADHAVYSIPAVYENGAAATTPYTAIAAENYGGLGTIAYVLFSRAPSEPVTASVLGCMDASGALIASGPSILEDLLVRAGVDDGDLDATILADSKRLAAAAGYNLAGLVNEDQPLQQWVTTLLLHMLGDSYLTVDGKLALRLKVGFDELAAVAADIAEQDVVTLECEEKTDNLVNDVTLRYRRNWASGAFEGALSPSGVAAKSGTGSATMTLSGVYGGPIGASYVVTIDAVSGGAEVGQATYKWSRDGGVTWAATGLTTSAAPARLEYGVSVAFTSGAGADFALGDTWTFTGMGTRDARSVSRYRRAYKHAEDLPWTRTDGAAAAVAAAYLSRFGGVDARVWNITVRTNHRNAQTARLGDHVKLTHSKLPFPAGKRLLRVLETAPAMDGDETRLVGQDYGRAATVLKQYDHTYLHDASIHYGSDAA